MLLIDRGPTGDGAKLGDDSTLLLPLVIFDCLSARGFGDGGARPCLCCGFGDIGVFTLYLF